MRWIIPLVFWGVAACAAPPELHIKGEVAPTLPGTDAAVMQRYAQGAITHITFHHEGFAGADADLFRRASAARDKQSMEQRLRNIHHDHAVNAGLGMIAYHYAVDKAGRIGKGRPVRFAPATRSTVKGGTRRADFTGHFAVVALGDFNHERLTDAARLSYIRVMSEAQRAFRVPSANILPHLHHASTSCPGRHIMAESGNLPRLVLIYGLQTELAARGCGPVQADGHWGSRSRAAFARLSRQNPSFRGRGPDDASLFALLDNSGLICK